MAINSCWLAGHHTEQPTEVANQLLPRLCRNSQSLKQTRKLFRCRTRLVRSNLTSCPVQQREILSSRHRQKTLVAAPSTLQIRIRSRLAVSLLQLHRSQMPTNVARPLLRSGIFAACFAFSSIRHGNSFRCGEMLTILPLRNFRPSRTSPIAIRQPRT